MQKTVSLENATHIDY